eukprot:COSAG05_NODE_2192_length_3419_cov_2.728916_2_plen_102_part_00
MLGRLPFDWAATFSVVSLVAGWVGQFGVTKLVAKCRSASLIVLALATMVLLAGLLLGYVGVSHVVQSLKDGQALDLSFHSPCTGVRRGGDSDGTGRPFRSD